MDTERLWQAMSEAIGRKLRVLRVSRGVLRVAAVIGTAFFKVFGMHNPLDEKQYDQMIAPAFLCSSEALQAAHQWTPRISLVQSLAKAWTAYRADGWL